MANADVAQALQDKLVELREHASAQPATVFNQRKLRAIAKRCRLDLIVLFSSQTTRNSNNHSNPAIAVKPREFRKPFGRRRIGRLTRALKGTCTYVARLAVVVLDDTDSNVMRQVVCTGDVRCERTPESWIGFASYANRRWYDDEKYRIGREAFLRLRCRFRVPREW